MAGTLLIGEPAPWFKAPVLDGNAAQPFSVLGGRWVVMLLLGSTRHPASDAILRLIRESAELFRDDRACLVGVTIDPGDAVSGRIARSSGVRWILDYDRAVSSLYGASSGSGPDAEYAPHWLLLDPALRVRGIAQIAEGRRVMDELRHILSIRAESRPAPILATPDVLPPDLCRLLIDTYDRRGGTPSGFMREEEGLTHRRMDARFKVRSDHHIDDGRVLRILMERLSRTIKPMIARAFQFDANRIERWLVACYSAEDGGHFRAHRDNTSLGTAHRRFACTINLNDDYDGGDLRFPEFGPETHRAEPGGAIVFSCSLMHEVTPVTRGRRYAFLPFLYDDEGARIRERNQVHLASGRRDYRSGLDEDGADAETGES